MAEYNIIRIPYVEDMFLHATHVVFVSFFFFFVTSYTNGHGPAIFQNVITVYTSCLWLNTRMTYLFIVCIVSTLVEKNQTNIFYLCSTIIVKCKMYN